MAVQWGCNFKFAKPGDALGWGVRRPQLALDDVDQTQAIGCYVASEAQSLQLRH